MKRRQVLTGLLAVTAAGLMPSASRRLDNTDLGHIDQPNDILPPLIDPIRDRERSSPVPSSILAVEDDGINLDNPESLLVNKATVDRDRLTADTPKDLEESAVALTSGSDIPSSKSQTLSGEWFDKTVHFDQDYVSDIYVSDVDRALLLSVHLRLKKLQSTIGYGHFNVVNFDDAITFSKRFSDIGQFTAAELAFVESIFAYDAKRYGFYGEKVTKQMTESIKKSSIFKVPYTGHYLFNEYSFAYYEKIRQSVGDGIILTSGIRSVVKQLHLFLAKVVAVGGNYSRASRSLAPPGYSYHGIGDFDVGRKGWGHKNFTDAFSETVEFKRMQDLGYVAIRYDHGNALGVRFEPWHIKVV